jgi:hypothetical protein
VEAGTAVLRELVTTGSGRPGNCETPLSGSDGGEERRCVVCGADVGSRFIQRASSVRLKKERP